MFNKKGDKMFITKEKKMEQQEIKFQNLQKQEEYQLAKSLGLEIQQEIIKIENMGFTCINKFQINSLLGLETNQVWERCPFDLFEGKIPFGVLCKINETKEKNIFDDFIVVYPEDKANDPLLIARKKIKIRMLQVDDYYDLEILFILAKWE